VLAAESICFPLLYSTARSAGVQLCCAEFVIYERLFKASPVLPERIELHNRLMRALADRHLTPYKINVEDLQDPEVLRIRKKLSLGELSVLVFARKTSQAVFTDDRGVISRPHKFEHVVSQRSSILQGSALQRECSCATWSLN
jgi:hypothetical protein